MTPQSRRLLVDRASRRPSPLPISDFARAERLFLKEKLAPSSFKQFKLEVLERLCESKGLALDPLARRKDDYITAIRAAHRQRTEIRSISTNTAAPTQATSVPHRDLGNASTLSSITHFNPSPSAGNAEAEVGPVDLIPPSNAARDGPGLETDQEMGDPDQLITLRLFKERNDWHPLQEVVYQSADGDVSLSEVHRLFRCPEGYEVHALDPRCHRPFYHYDRDKIVRADVEDLMENGILRMIYVKKKNARR